MNVAKEILQKVKDIFNASAEPVAPVAASADVKYTLKDGTEISVTQAGEKIAAGDTVKIGDAPAPAGTHELSDGTAITVDESGVVTAVTEAQAPDEPAAPEAPEMEARIAALESEVAKLRQPVTQMSEEQTQKFSAYDDKIKKQGEVIAALFELCDELVKQPTTEPKTLTERDRQKFEKREKKEEKFKGILDSIKNKDKK